MIMSGVLARHRRCFTGLFVDLGRGDQGPYLDGLDDCDEATGHDAGDNRHDEDAPCEHRGSMAGEGEGVPRIMRGVMHGRDRGQSCSEE